MGVGPGDRVVAYLPNIPETVVAFYACISLGAIWSSCSPDMGTRSVTDRFRQIDPKVMIAVDGYRYGGKNFDRLSVVAQLQRELPTVEKVVLLPYLDAGASLPGSVSWDDMLTHDVPMRFEQVAFDHPLWVVYSSGTTGMPKPIVHGHGGAMLEGLQGQGMHMDLQADDRYMWFTTTGWIMWNAQIGGLLVGATICIYDGNPGYPDLSVLWKFAEETGITFFGAGAAYYLNCKKADLDLAGMADLSRIRAAIRENLSARHIPNDIVQVAEIPRTLTGKKMELPIKKLLLGKPLAEVANPDAMANPQSLDIYIRFAEDRDTAPES